MTRWESTGHRGELQGKVRKYRGRAGRTGQDKNAQSAVRK